MALRPPETGRTGTGGRQRTLDLGGGDWLGRRDQTERLSNLSLTHYKRKHSYKGTYTHHYERTHTHPTPMSIFEILGRRIIFDFVNHLNLLTF